MNIGMRIKERRKEMKRSADELGAKLGKDRSTIYRYEKGDIENLPLDILEPIAKALDTTPQYLMGWQNAIENSPVEMATLHAEMIMDEDMIEIYGYFKKMSAKKRSLAKDLIRNLAETDF